MGNGREIGGRIVARRAIAAACHKYLFATGIIGLPDRCDTDVVSNVPEGRWPLVTRNPQLVAGCRVISNRGEIVIISGRSRRNSRPKRGVTSHVESLAVTA